jgi:hypothetical protein
MLKFSLAVSLLGLALLVPKPSFAYWTHVLVVDPDGDESPTPSSVNNGFMDGGWFSTNIGHESVAHHATMNDPNSWQTSSFGGVHHFEKTYQWNDPTCYPDDISFPCHGEVSGARSGAYTNASSNIVLESNQSWLGASAGYYSQSYQQGKDETSAPTIFEQNSVVVNWTTYSGASGGRPSPYGYYSAWAKVAFYTGEATTVHTTPRN